MKGTKFMKIFEIYDEEIREPTGEGVNEVEENTL